MHRAKPSIRLRCVDAMAGNMLIFFLLLVFGRAEALECYKCSGTTNLEECMSTVTCREGQVCYVKRTYSGQVLYDLGCADKQTCGNYANRSTANAVMGISSELTHSCHECCSTDKCNRDICVNRNPSLCVDDDSFDCALLNSLFDICTHINRAKKYCPQYCDLCDVVDGNWSPWSSWSLCDVTCENGTLTRIRTCSDPAPQNGGLNCQGIATEVRPCIREVCPVHGGWAQWTKWSSCSTTCGIGMKRRSRTCSNPFPSRFGDHCFGDTQEYKQCHQGPCTNCGWSEWQTWSNCSTECGIGFRNRSRACSNPTPSPLGSCCPGSPIQTGSCESTCNGGWTNWQSWSNCNGDECETGFRLRSRTCSNPKPSALGMYCPGRPTEISSCKTICYTDCYDIKRNQSYPKSGIYTVRLWHSKRKIHVFCDMRTDYGGWTVIQNRFDGSEDFYRTFSEYENGFGDLKNEFWLGLSIIQEIASQGESDLRIDLEAANGSMAFETLTDFCLTKGPDYTLHVGPTIESLRISSSKRFGSYHNGSKFSAYDHDVDSARYNCAGMLHGGWWYNKCGTANLNGQYKTPGKQDGEAMVYHSFMDYSSLKSSKIMIRRK